MNRLFLIEVGSLEIKGLISPGELPEVVRLFYGVSAQRGAKADYLGEGKFIAEKNEVRLTLTIGEYHKAIPSRMLVDVLEEVMAEYFL